MKRIGCPTSSGSYPTGLVRYKPDKPFYDRSCIPICVGRILSCPGLPERMRRWSNCLPDSTFRYDGEYPAPSFAGGRTGCCRTLQGRPVWPNRSLHVELAASVSLTLLTTWNRYRPPLPCFLAFYPLRYGVSGSGIGDDRYSYLKAARSVRE